MNTNKKREQQNSVKDKQRGIEFTVMISRPRQMIKGDRWRRKVEINVR